MKCKLQTCNNDVIQTGVGRPKVFCGDECRKLYWDAEDSKARTRAGKRGSDCKMTDVDPITRLGTCSQHGPGVKAYAGGGKARPDRWRCSRRIRSQESVRNPKLHPDLLVRRVRKLVSNGVDVTVDQLREAEARAAGHCECCGRPASLHVDHDHETRRFRGLLCSTCNTGIGKLGDRELGLLAALSYLRGRAAEPITGEHLAHMDRVRAAGCLHPAVYAFRGGLIFGWCELCRSNAGHPPPDGVESIPCTEHR